MKGFVRGPPAATWTQLHGEGQPGARKTDADLIGKRAIAVMTVPEEGVCQFSDNRGFFATEAGPGWTYGRMVHLHRLCLSGEGVADRLFPSPLDTPETDGRVARCLPSRKDAVSPMGRMWYVGTAKLRATCNIHLLDAVIMPGGRARRGRWQKPQRGGNVGIIRI